jgi:phosphohistidine phosphatase
MAEYLAARGIFSPREIWHSPLLRAQETAALLKSHGKLGAKLVQTPGLTPEDSAQRIARQLRASPVESLALVGHEPHLSSLASLLVAGGPGAAHFRFAKCAVLALEGGADFWVVNWLLAPDLVAKP